MRAKIIATFPHCVTNNCLESQNQSVFYIYDHHTLKRCFVNNTSMPANYPFFTVNNTTNKEINFLAIDNCILFAADGKKCDFALFDDKEIHFVELKRGFGPYGSQKKNDAVRQLRESLVYFKGQLDLTKYRILACICVGYSRPSPAASASDLNLMVDFINRYDTELYEGNVVNFN